MAIKKTLLEIVQNILSDLDSEEINSISESVEAAQVAVVVENTFYNIVATREIPEHHSLIKITALSDSSFPTHFTYPDNVKGVTGLWYDTTSDNTWDYAEIKFCAPREFLSRVGTPTTNYTLVDDKVSGTKMRIANNKMPTFYTTFDDTHIIMDAHDSTVDTTLSASKTRAMGYTIPVFSVDDAYVPDLDAEMFQYLVNESKSVCFSLFKGGPDPKVDQAARRQKSYTQNDMYKTKRANSRPLYGRG
jgi:hypothetical protein